MAGPSLEARHRRRHVGHGAPMRSRTALRRPDAQHADGAGDVLDRLRAEVVEGGGDLARHMVVGRARDGDPARLGQRLDARGDVHPVAVDVVFLDDDVAHIDADADEDARRLGEPLVAARQFGLHVERMADGVDRAGNSTSVPSPVVLTMRPPYCAILGCSSSALQRPDARERPRLVGLHQSRVADDVGGHDGGKAALGAGFGHSGGPARRSASTNGATFSIGRFQKLMELLIVRVGSNARERRTASRASWIVPSRTREMATPLYIWLSLGFASHAFFGRFNGRFVIFGHNVRGEIALWATT